MIDGDEIEMNEAIEIILDKFKKNTNRCDIINAGMDTGYRIYFDPYCKEWKDISLNQKLSFYEILEDSSISFADFIKIYRAFWIKAKRYDIAHAVADAINIVCYENYKRYHRN